MGLFSKKKTDKEVNMYGKKKYRKVK